MVSGTDPADVIRAVADGVTRLVTGTLSPAEHERQLDELAALYAEQTDVRHPFAPLGAPILRTRAELRAHFAAAGTAQTRTVEQFDWRDARVMRTDDPEVVVFEFARTVRALRREHEVHFIYVVRVRNGEIVESRDYADHLAMARAVGRLDAVADALKTDKQSADDVRAITDLVNRHGPLVDDGALDRLDELFTVDAVYDTRDLGGGELRGLDATRDAAWQLGAGNPVAHHVTNVVVTVLGHETARVESKGLGVLADATVGSVSYHDHVVRTVDGWRIDHRVIRARREPLAGRGRADG